MRFLRAFTIDASSLRAFRFLLGALWLLDLIHRFPDAAAHYSDEGVLTLAEAALAFPAQTFSTLWLWPGAPWFARALFAASAVATALFAAGRGGRAAAAAAWFLCVAIQARNELVLYGSDHMMRVLFFWAIFLPARPRGPVSSAASAAILLQVVWFYLFGALLKTGVEWTREGSALYYAFSFDQFATPLARFLLGYPALLKVATFATLALELLSPILLLATRGRARLAGVGLFAALHIGIACTLKLGLIPWVNLCALVLFLPAEAWLRKPDPAAPARRGPWPVLLLAAYAFAWNALDPPLTARAWWMWPGYALRLDQNWGFFAPFPYKSDGWWRFPAEGRDGSPRDGWTGGPPFDERPPDLQARYGSAHWHTYFLLYNLPEHEGLRPRLVRYLCRRSPELSRVSVVFEEELTGPPGSEPKRSTYRLADGSCPPSG